MHAPNQDDWLCINTSSTPTREKHYPCASPWLCAQSSDVARHLEMLEFDPKASEEELAILVRNAISDSGVYPTGTDSDSDATALANQILCRDPCVVAVILAAALKRHLDMRSQNLLRWAAWSLGGAGLFISFALYRLLSIPSFLTVLLGLGLAYLRKFP